MSRRSESAGQFTFRTPAGIGLLILALHAFTAEARPFKDLCEQFEPLRKISDLKYVKHAVRVVPKSESVKPQDVVFTIEARAGVIRVAPSADGTLQLPFTDRLCAENPNIEVNQPQDTIDLSIVIDPAIPPVRELDYRLLEALRREWSEAVSRQSLLWRMLAPEPRGYQIVFEPGRAASVELRLPQGTRRLMPDAKGVVRIPFEDAWASVNPAIVLSELPKRIGLAFKS